MPSLALIRRAVALFALALLLAAPPAAAVEPEERLADPVLEERARSLSKGLRCVVCPNQSIDDSDAPLAQDMRRMVRQRLLAGDTDQQILDRLEASYGRRIHMEPPLEFGTILLWLSAPLALAAGIWIYLQRVRVRPATAGPEAEPAPTAPPPPDLSPEERERLRRLLDD